MSQLDLLRVAARPPQMADTSLEAFEAILPTLKRRELEVLWLLYEYLRSTDYEDATGGELAAWSGRDKCSIRPRLTGLDDLGLIEKQPARRSRAGELKCNPYVPVLPREAVARARRELLSAVQGR